MSQRFDPALMQYAMRQALKKQNRNIKAAIAGQLAYLRPQEDKTHGVQMTETRIYVGLNDGETRAQLYDTETYLSILKDICRSCHVAFSVDVEEGGYYHEDGEYTEETSLVLILINTERDVVDKIAQELRTRFHQESVLITEDRISGCFIVGESAEENPPQ